MDGREREYRRGDQRRNRIKQSARKQEEDRQHEHATNDCDRASCRDIREDKVEHLDQREVERRMWTVEAMEPDRRRPVLLRIEEREAFVQPHAQAVISPKPEKRA